MWETFLDIANLGYSAFNMIKNPSWVNFGYLAWDAGATLVPFVPCSYTAKAFKVAGKDASKVIKGTSYDINKLYKTQPYIRDVNVKGIKEIIQSKGPNAVEPIKILVHKSDALVIDGHHSLEAFKQLGFNRVPIRYMHKNQVYREYGRTIDDILALKHT